MKVKIEPYGGHTDGNGSEICSQTMGDIFSYAAACELLSNAASYRLWDEGSVNLNSCPRPLGGEGAGWGEPGEGVSNLFKFVYISCTRFPASYGSHLMSFPAPKAKKGGTAQVLLEAEH
jgi:hypothetical protein